jgi:hypothetical protein
MVLRITGEQEGYSKGDKGGLHQKALEEPGRFVKFFRLLLKPLD